MERKVVLLTVESEDSEVTVSPHKLDPRDVVEGHTQVNRLT